MMKRMKSKKSHSWRWDNHIGPKNSKWLAENLEDMEQSVKRMLKLIEEEGDSFAKKAEMYYQKRPELVFHVEEFYRMYRSLAERYDHVTGELRKNIPSDLHSQGSGISDASSEPTSKWLSSAKRLEQHRSGHRAAGFDFFLSSGENNSDQQNKEGDEMSSSLDSESDSDDSSVNNYSSLTMNASDEELQKKINELEIKLREATQKLQFQKVEGSAEGSSRGAVQGSCEDLHTRIVGYEKDLWLSKEKIRLSEDETTSLKIELQKYRPVELISVHQTELESMEKDVKTKEIELSQGQQNSDNQESVAASGGEVAEPPHKIQALVVELRKTKERHQDSEKEIASLRCELESINNSSKSISHLQDQLELAHKDLSMWKAKFNSERREISKLQERIARYKTNLSDREHEIRELKVSISDAGGNYYIEKLQLQEKISKLIQVQTHLEEKLKEWELHGRNLEDEIKRVEAQKAELEGSHKAIEIRQNSEIEQLKTEISKREKHVGVMNESLDALKLKHDILISERDELRANVLALTTEVSAKDDRIDQLDKHLHNLHTQYTELVTKAEGAQKLLEEMSLKTEELEDEVERQRLVISEGAEEKRAAIRQLCVSIEHYRDEYHLLRRAIIGHKRPAVLAL